MHENELTKEIIGAAIEVHRWLGPGLLEGVYEESLCHELHARGVPFKRQQRVPISYKGVSLATDLRLDLLVDGRIIVDVKAKESLAPTDKPQLLTYLRLCDLKVGLNQLLCSGLEARRLPCDERLSPRERPSCRSS